MDDITKAIIVSILTVFLIVAEAIKMVFGIYKKHQRKSEMKESISSYYDRMKNNVQ